MKLSNLFVIIFCTLWISETNASQISFRDVLESDIPELNILMRRSKEVAGKSRYTEKYLDDFMRQLSFTSKILEISKAKVLLCDQKIAGFYSFYINEDGQLELDNFFLDPKFLYKGYGKVLWDHCIKTAKEYPGKLYFVIWSSLEAFPFYLKRGCIKIGEKPSPADSNLIQPMLQYNLSDHSSS